MSTIARSADTCTVIVTVDAEPDAMADLEAHAREGLRQFARAAGFVRGALHKSTDGRRLVQYLQWRSEADHHACMNDPRWEDAPTTRRFMELIDSGRATMDVRIYDVTAVVEPS
jgi:quinol monooxygenase YgiN